MEAEAASRETGEVIQLDDAPQLEIDARGKELLKSLRDNSTNGSQRRFGAPD